MMWNSSPVKGRLGGVMQLFNLSALKPKRKLLRKNMPAPELRLWNRLRNKQLDGHKFRRQHSIGGYIIDFYCPKRKLALEIDGDSHYFEKAKKCDIQRTKFLTSVSVQVIRFTNKEVMDNIDRVLVEIRRVLTTSDHP
jgi:very-short-patch-repair endonuclease